MRALGRCPATGAHLERSNQLVQRFFGSGPREPFHTFGIQRYQEPHWHVVGGMLRIGVEVGLVRLRTRQPPLQL